MKFGVYVSQADSKKYLRCSSLSRSISELNILFNTHFFIFQYDLKQTLINSDIGSYKSFI